MVRQIINALIIAGSALMIVNIIGFVKYAVFIKGRRKWKEEMGILYAPIVLLCLFFLGYVTVGLFGSPDIITAFILFGGSIFVFIIMLLLKRITNAIIESEQMESNFKAAEKEYCKRLEKAETEATIDALTGVKNRNAYRVYEENLNARISQDPDSEFAVVILDVNDLKKINDNLGHKVGDQLLKDACKIICNTFKHSPVFRVGGDEFAVIAQGNDLSQLDVLINRMDDHNEEAVKNGGIVIAAGMAYYQHDEKVSQVYERADQKMYENKSYLKNKSKLSE